ncbi:decarboxylating 6-phosphogluconate dehydrogenase [Candidatus Dependentiae bacterium]|nr:decarboxylating 6-phosphogluconate dehydrogenase [Candidatus Dependentiae bacterium]
MDLGLIGLGKMGQAIAYRLSKDNHKIFAYDPNVNKVNIKNVKLEKNIVELTKKTKIIWLMLPASKVDLVINNISPHLQKDSILIDGGNSNFQETIKRYNNLKSKNINYLDCGTSGGIQGEKIGFCLMLGGDKNIYLKIESILKSIAAPNGYAYIGPSGAGHYIKMIHNGIEYSLLQAYAEGFNLLKNNDRYKNLDLEKISNLWMHGSIIRSWILELAHNIFQKDQELLNISGNIGENLTGRWTLQETKEQKIPMNLLEQSLKIRKWSRESGGNFATKIIAKLRNKFGGHPIKKID